MEYAYWFEVWIAVKSHLSNPKTNEIIHFDNYIQMVRSMIIVFTMRSYADLMLIAAAMLKSGWKECSMHHFQISFHTYTHTHKSKQLNDHCFSISLSRFTLLGKRNLFETSTFYNLLYDFILHSLVFLIRL